MNKSKKVIIALIAVLTAVALFLLGAMSLFIAGGDKLEDMLDKREDDLKTVVFQKEYSINDFQKMKIDCGCADVTFKPSQNGNVSITVFGAKDNKFSGEIKDETLELNEIYGKAISLGGKFDISTNTGDISIKNAKPFENSSLKTDTGDIEVDNVLNTKIISEADTGNEDVNGSDDSSGVTLTVTTDTGDIEVNDN